MPVMLNTQAVDTTINMSMFARSSGLGCGCSGLGRGWLSNDLFDGVVEI